MQRPAFEPRAVEEGDPGWPGLGKMPWTRALVALEQCISNREMHLDCDQNKYNKDKINTRPWFPVLFQLKGLLRDKAIPNLAGKCKISLEHLVRLHRKE